MKTFKIKGMHCASCAAIITRELTRLEGVRKVEVNFATEKAKIDFDENRVSLGQMNEQIGKLGYSLVPESGDGHPANHGGEHNEHVEHLGISQTKEEKIKELLKMKAKVQISLPVSLLIFALMMWDIASKLFGFIPNLPLPMEFFNTISMILATVMVFWIGSPFLMGIWHFVRHRAANMDTLIGIGTLTAYIYSAVITLFPAVKELARLPDYTYFDVTIVVIGFVILGKYLEAGSKLKTGQAIEKLLGLQAKTALVFRDGKEKEVHISEVAVGDVVVMKPGTKIPVDGVIIEGVSSIDESMVTGESVPVDKKEGEAVIGGTINKHGAFKFRASKVGSDTVLAQIIRMVEEAQGSKAPIQEIADKVSAVFVPVVLALSAIALASWLLLGSSYLGFSAALSYGIMAFVGILVIACPCALGLATPTAIIVGVGKGAEHGILIKNAENLEKLSSVEVIVFDKTGTITKGSPTVTDIISVTELPISPASTRLGETGNSQFLGKSQIKNSKNLILQIAASIEKKSEHPLAQAIVQKAEEKKIDLLEVNDFAALEGFGVKALVGGETVVIRKPGPDETGIPQVKLLQEQGKTVVVVEVGRKKAGLIALSDTIKDGAKEAIAGLHEKGVKSIMLTGDNYAAARHIAGQVGIDEVMAEVLPQEKAQKIKELQAAGKKVAMAGDGVNDAPALVQADVGIAMATGTDVAIESAGITLLKGDINKISQAIFLSRITMRTIKQNLFWAFIYNVVGIPVAAGILFPFFGIFLNPIFAGLAMAGSSVSVVGNSLRLKAKKLK